MTHNQGQIIIRTINDRIDARMGNNQAYIGLSLDTKTGKMDVIVHNEHASAMNSYSYIDFLKFLEMFGTKCASRELDASR